MRLNECGCGCGGPMGGCIGNEEKETENYMVRGNLETMHRLLTIMLAMDPEEMDALIKNGHDWAEDHIASAKDDLEEVADFFMNELKSGEHEEHGGPFEEGDDRHEEKESPFVHTFESFTSLNEAKKAKKKKDQDGDGDSDFADAKIAQYTAGGVSKKKAVAMSRKFNK